VNEKDHVETLAFPARLPFKILIKEARINIDEFRSQFLCEYVESESAKFVPTFVLEELNKKVKPISFFDGKQAIRTVAALDTANSESITADRSSICVARVFEHEGKSVAFILEIIAGQWRYSNLAEKLVDACEKYGIKQAVIEKNGIPWQDFQSAVQRHALLRGVILPEIQWSTSTGTG